MSSIRWLRETGILQTVGNLVLDLNWIPTDTLEVLSVFIWLLCFGVPGTRLQILSGGLNDKDTAWQYLWEPREISSSVLEFDAFLLSRATIAASEAPGAGS